MSENISMVTMKRILIAWECVGVVAIVYAAGVTVILACVVVAGR